MGLDWQYCTMQLMFIGAIWRCWKRPAAEHHKDKVYADDTTTKRLSFHPRLRERKLPHNIVALRCWSGLPITFEVIDVL